MEPGQISVKNLLSEFNVALADLYPPEEIRGIAYILFLDYLGWPRATVHLSYDKVLPAATGQLFRKALADLATGKPVQYVTCNTWFNGFRLRVSQAVLIPRPETEELCELVGKRMGEMTGTEFAILDIGTGSGCIAIDMKRRFPAASVTAIDNSRDAMDMAELNAKENGCPISFRLSDIFSPADHSQLGRYHLIVSNPPYVTDSEEQLMRKNVRDFEPGQALFVPDHDPLLYYRVIAGFAREHLERQGRLFFEINERFGAGVSRLLRSAGFGDVTIYKDIQGKDRFAEAISEQV